MSQLELFNLKIPLISTTSNIQQPLGDTTMYKTNDKPQPYA